MMPLLCKLAQKTQKISFLRIVSYTIVISRVRFDRFNYKNHKIKKILNAKNKVKMGM